MSQFTGLVHSQNYEWDSNLPNYDNRLMHYGFTIGLNTTRFRAIRSPAYFPGDSIIAIKTPSKAGFSLGFIMNLRLGDYLDLRLTPDVAFFERTVEFTFGSGRQSKQTAESVFIETPLMLKYKSMRRHNNRMYLVGGIKPAIEAGAKKKEKKKNELRTNNMDFSIDYGVGLDLYFKFFKFAPELRFSHSLVNILNKDPNPYSESLLKLTTHTVTLYLHFE
ncbi:MAG: PorT family protein [Cytophagaceae bacterium]|nr:PorT family protein [Cytophagaceae bacterium]MDW8455210.1 porin family protein [Cytophagaceae bacterium]